MALLFLNYWFLAHCQIRTKPMHQPDSLQTENGLVGLDLNPRCRDNYHITHAVTEKWYFNKKNYIPFIVPTEIIIWGFTLIHCIITCALYSLNVMFVATSKSYCFRYFSRAGSLNLRFVEPWWCRGHLDSNIYCAREMTTQTHGFPTGSYYRRHGWIVQTKWSINLLFQKPQPFNPTVCPEKEDR